MLAIALGIFTIILGTMAFTPAGIPLTKKKNLTGITAKVIGTFCLLLGAAFIADGLFASFNIVRLFTGGVQ